MFALLESVDTDLLLYVILFLLLIICGLSYLCIKLFKIKKKNKYYLDTIRTVSKSICQNHEIVAFDDSDSIVYATRPFYYRDKLEFLRSLSSRVNASDALLNFQTNVEQNNNYSILLTGEGNGLQNTEKKWMAVSNFVEEDESFINGSMLVVVLTEITKYVEETEKINRNYLKLEKFLDKFPLGIFYINNSGIVIGANTTFASMLMISKDRVIGAAIGDFIDDFNPDIAQQRPTTVMIKPKFSNNFQAILIKSSAHSNYTGQPWIVCRTEQKSRTQQDTNKFIEQDSFISASVPAAIVTVLGNVVAINPSFANLINEHVVFDKTKIVNHVDNIKEYIIYENGNSDIISYIKKVASSDEQQSPIEVKLVGENVTALAFVSKISGYTAKNEKLIYVQLVDISSKKKLEEQFIQSQKMQAVGQLAGGIAHDFNNLLTAIIGFCDLLLQKHTPNDHSYAELIQIKQNANRAANLVKQLLAFSRQQNMKPEVLSITDNIADLNALLKRLIGANIDFKIIHGKDIWPVKADNSQLEQVIINLVINARDSMANVENPILVIKTNNFTAHENFKCVYDTGIPGDYVLIEVIDNGCGIPDDQIERIFDPFFTSKGPKSGTGLGLSTVYGIINQTGGFIRVKSKINTGTTFQIFLPKYVGNESYKQVKQEVQPKDLTGTETILLVEDEEAVRMFAARSLREKGYTVIEAGSGEDAVKEAEQAQNIDLLITDVIMPHMDGPTLNSKLRTMIKNLKTIFISGYTEDIFRKNLDKEANIHFVQKPFTLKNLLIKVKEVLSNEK